MRISKYIPEESRWEEETMIGVVINNMPNLGRDTKYIVCRLYDCRLWYYGQWSKEFYEQAKKVAETIHGVIVEVKD